jgi:hypothetical protein
LGQDDGLAEHCVVRPTVGPDRAGHDVPGRDADVEGETAGEGMAAKGGELRMHVLGSTNGPHRVVLVGDRSAEERQEGVTGELLQPAVVAGHDPSHRLQDRIEDSQQLLGVQPTRQRREARDVREERRHPTAFLDQLLGREGGRRTAVRRHDRIVGGQRARGGGELAATLGAEPGGDRADRTAGADHVEREPCLVGHHITSIVRDAHSPLFSRGALSCRR